MTRLTTATGSRPNAGRLAPQPATGRFGFCSRPGGVHLRRTMMLAELRTLLTVLPPEATSDEYRQAILVDNILGKPTLATRKTTGRYLAQLYGLDPTIPLFRILRSLWDLDTVSQPLLALLAATARDPLLRESSSVILSAGPGESVDGRAFGALIGTSHPHSYSKATLRALGTRFVSSWTQSGHLAGKATRHRTHVRPTVTTVVFALVLGFLEDQRGQLLFQTLWARLLDSPAHVLRAMAQVASARGLITFKAASDVVEVDVSPLLTEQERKMASESA